MMASQDLFDLFQERKMVKICAPMVRYSKLAFRTLVRLYDCDLCFTPMIMADSFVKSEEARNNEFTTHSGDKPLVVQFAANNVDDFVLAAEMVANYSCGVDLNCGCPQHWARSECLGAYLLDKPQLVKDMILQVRNRIPRPYAVSAKIRIKKDLRLTIDLCKSLEAAGLSFLTVHARTVEERSQPINTEALKLINETVSVPVVGNGDVKTLHDAEQLQQATGCKGIMSARGVLANPALYAGYVSTPVECVQNWLTLNKIMKLQFQTFHHHLVFMLERVLPKQERCVFNCLKDEESVLSFLRDYFEICPGDSQNCLKNACKWQEVNCEYASILCKCNHASKQKLINESCSELVLEGCTIFSE